MHLGTTHNQKPARITIKISIKYHNKTRKRKKNKFIITQLIKKNIKIAISSIRSYQWKIAENSRIVKYHKKTRRKKRIVRYVQIVLIAELGKVKPWNMLKFNRNNKIQLWKNKQKYVKFHNCYNAKQSTIKSLSNS